MTSLNGNLFRVTSPLCAEFAGHREVRDLRRHRTHYSVILMMHLVVMLSVRTDKSSENNLSGHLSIYWQFVPWYRQAVLWRVNYPTWMLSTSDKVSMQGECILLTYYRWIYKWQCSVLQSYKIYSIRTNQIKAQPPFEVHLADWPWSSFRVCANLLRDQCSCRSYNFKCSCRSYSFKV